MASFCSNCGFPLGASNAFCPKCGTRLTAQPVQPAPAPPPQAAMPPQYTPPAYTPAPAVAAKSGSGLKILLVVFCVFAFLGIAVVGGVIYVGHRVKQAVVSKAASYGVDLKSVADSSSSSSTSSAPLRKACEYVSKEEVSRIIGEPIERTTTDGAACL